VGLLVDLVVPTTVLAPVFLVVLFVVLIDVLNVVSLLVEL